MSYIVGFNPISSMNFTEIQQDSTGVQFLWTQMLYIPKKDENSIGGEFQFRVTCFLKLKIG